MARGVWQVAQQQVRRINLQGVGETLKDVEVDVPHRLPLEAAHGCLAHTRATGKLGLGPTVGPSKLSKTQPDRGHEFIIRLCVFDRKVKDSQQVRLVNLARSR